MASVYGMKFKGDHFNLIVNEGGAIIYMPDEFVVHPDSLPILAPVGGDLLYKARSMDLLWLPDPLNVDAGYLERVIAEYTVVVWRNRKSFIWPEEREV